MKTKILLIAFSFACLSLNAQIFYENMYPIQVISNRLMAVYLKHAGTKYFLRDSTGFKLYNLNHTLYKSVTLPPDTFAGINNTLIFYVTEDLFDSDSSTIDYYLYRYSQSNQSLFYTKILDENGNALFFSDTLQGSRLNGGELNSAPYFDQKFIVQTDDGAKMLLSDEAHTKSYVYDLPGNIYTPCPCQQSQPLDVQGYSGGKPILNNYPNPSSGKTIIEYDLPKGVHDADLIIYTTSGDMIKQYHVTDSFRTLEFDSGFLPSGNYFYQLIIPGGISQAKKMIVVK